MTSEPLTTTPADASALAAAPPTHTAETGLLVAVLLLVVLGTAAMLTMV